MSFAELLRSQVLTVNHGEPRPCDNCVFIGPTAVDLTAASSDFALPQWQIQRESQLIKHWRQSTHY